MSTSQRPHSSGGALIVLIVVGLVCGRAYHRSGGHYYLSRFYNLPYTVTKAEIKSEIDRAADSNSLPRAVLHALVHVESGLNPKAVSRRGAIGVTQVMPFNAKRCGLTPKQLFDPILSVRCGSKILREELDRVGNMTDALTVYNCGTVRCAEGKQYANKVLSLAEKLG